MTLINLLPEDYIEQRRQRRANLYCLGLFAVVMIGVLSAVSINHRNYNRTKEVSDRVDASYTEAAKLIAQMQELQAQKANMLAKAESTSALMERMPRSYLLAMLTNALPENASLTKFSLDIKRIVGKPAARPEPTAKATSGTGGKPPTRESAARAKRGPAPVASEPVVAIEVTGLAATDVEVASLIGNLQRNPLTQSVDLVYSQQKQHGEALIREFQVKIDMKINADARAAIKAITRIGKEAFLAAAGAKS